MKTRRLPDVHHLRSLYRIPLGLGGLYLLLLLLSALGTERLIFPAPPPSYQHIPGGFTLHGGAGETLAALTLEQPGATYWVLFSHGNGEDLGGILPFLHRYRDQGYNLLAYDYPGYGRSSGRASEQGCYRAITAAYQWLRARGVAPEHILLHGRSLGGGPSTYLAARQPVGGLILESTFLSILQVPFPWRIFPWDYFDNQRRLAAVQAPLLVLHGSADRLVPIRHGRELYRQARSPKQALWVEGAGHLDLAAHAGDAFWQAIRAQWPPTPGTGKA